MSLVTCENKEKAELVDGNYLTAKQDNKAKHIKPDGFSAFLFKQKLKI